MTRFIQKSLAIVELKSWRWRYEDWNCEVHIKKGVRRESFLKWVTEEGDVQQEQDKVIT